MSEYLLFELDEEASVGRKTNVWFVLSARNPAHVLGRIEWYGRWRQYTFHPSQYTIFNPDCLKEIADKCSSLTAEHMERKRREAATGGR